MVVVVVKEVVVVEEVVRAVVEEVNQASGKTIDLKKRRKLVRDYDVLTTVAHTDATGNELHKIMFG